MIPDTTAAPAAQVTATTTNALSRPQWVEQITDAWQTQALDVVLTGMLLKRAKAELRHGDFIAMIESELPFSRQTADKLMKIAACDYFQDDAHVRHLPTSWGTLCELTKLTPEQFESGIESGDINPKMQRKDVLALRGVKPKVSDKQSLKEQLAEKDREIERLRLSGGDLFTANDTARDIANIVFKTVNSVTKVERVILELCALKNAREKKDGR